MCGSVYVVTFASLYACMRVGVHLVTITRIQR